MSLNVRSERLDVNTTSRQIAKSRMASNPRTLIQIRNSSPNATDIITLNFGRDKATSLEGVILRQNDVMTDVISEGYIPWQEQINAVCSTINGKISVMER